MTNKKLYRSRHDVLIAGVCAGLAEHFDHDPTLWRLGFALFLVLTGFMPGVLLYIIAWIVIPAQPLHRVREVEPEAVESD